MPVQQNSRHSSSRHRQHSDETIRNEGKSSGKNMPQKSWNSKHSYEDEASKNQGKSFRKNVQQNFLNSSSRHIQRSDDEATRNEGKSSGKNATQKFWDSSNRHPQHSDDEALGGNQLWLASWLRWKSTLKLSSSSSSDDEATRDEGKFSVKNVQQKSWDSSSRNRQYSDEDEASRNMSKIFGKNVQQKFWDFSSRHSQHSDDEASRNDGMPSGKNIRPEANTTQQSRQYRNDDSDDNFMDVDPQNDDEKESENASCANRGRTRSMGSQSRHSQKTQSSSHENEKNSGSPAEELSMNMDNMTWKEKDTRVGNREYFVYAEQNVNTSDGTGVTRSDTAGGWFKRGNGKAKPDGKNSFTKETTMNNSEHLMDGKNYRPDKYKSNTSEGLTRPKMGSAEIKPTQTSKIYKGEGKGSNSSARNKVGNITKSLGTIHDINNFDSNYKSFPRTSHDGSPVDSKNDSSSGNHISENEGGRSVTKLDLSNSCKRSSGRTGENASRSCNKSGSGNSSPGSSSTARTGRISNTSPSRSGESRSPSRKAGSRSPVHGAGGRGSIKGVDNTSLIRSADSRNLISGAANTSPSRNADSRSPSRSTNSRSPSRSADCRSPSRSANSRSPSSSSDSSSRGGITSISDVKKARKPERALAIGSSNASETGQRAANKRDYVKKMVKNIETEKVNRNMSNTSIEKHYVSNPANLTPLTVNRKNKARYVLDSKQMTQTNQQTSVQRTIRRVPQVSPWNTATPKGSKFVWFFKDEHSNWIKYGETSSSNNASHATTTTSDEIDLKYVQNPTASFEIASGHHKYIIDFKSMTQTNINTKAVRAIRRQLVTPSDLPSNWTPMKASDKGLRVVQLNSTDADYINQLAFVKKTLPSSHTITKVFRIQNEHLWMDFVTRKKLLKKRNPQIKYKEVYLFHGTNPKHVRSICAENLDFRLNGTNGTLYGKGTYFATSAAYSANYAGSGSTKLMFIVKVLIGHYTVGNSSLCRPPKDASGVFYDATVDNQANPKIYVKYDNTEYYPEYYFEFT